MGSRKQLIWLAAVLLLVGLGSLAAVYVRLMQAESWSWTSTAAPERASEYVAFAESLEADSPVMWQLLRLSPGMREHLEQRRREAAEYEAVLKPQLAAGERRQRMRADYDRSAAALRVSAPMIQAMLAVIDASIERGKPVPIRVQVENKIVPGDDADLALALGTGRVPGEFDVETGCSLEMRRNAEPLELDNAGGDEYGIRITYTLIENAYPLVLQEKRGEEIHELTVRGLATRVELQVVPPGGVPVRESRQVGSEGFARTMRVAAGDTIGKAHLYTEMLRTLADNACITTATLLGTRDAVPTQAE